MWHNHCRLAPSLPPSPSASATFLGGTRSAGWCVVVRLWALLATRLLGAPGCHQGLLDAKSKASLFQQRSRAKTRQIRWRALEGGEGQPNGWFLARLLACLLAKRGQSSRAAMQQSVTRAEWRGVWFHDPILGMRFLIRSKAAIFNIDSVRASVID